MQLTNLLVLGAALGAMAAPSGHSHLHRSVHEKRGSAFYKAVHHSKVGAPTTAASSTPAPVATTASAAPAAVSTSAAASTGTYKAFCGGVSKRATLADIASVGNVGTADNYGCNIMTVDNSIADKYDYTSVYTNVASESYQVVCGLKIGPTEDSQGFCAFAPGSVPKTPWGEWAGSWVEVDFASSRNNKWSGADCSSLVAASEGMAVSGCQVCDASDNTCSTIYSDGTGVNSFIAGTAALDGLGINAAPGPLKLNVKVGYSKGS
ncbi:hypothetical protein CONLIGDRAFT_112893 [Coniochaeta ligniaria NRRL 30616]|uniref:Allergen Asp f 4 n=1 Tax=Coniochaeta ligniaria NRRL 30616 TaxID=1408157 RepID=A0A1J7J8M5_9PEZI|nr:hypothetical protein CONLIGDRAFT_112893 [Coniochaeta ligniaria NRRL 30616]